MKADMDDMGERGFGCCVRLGGNDVVAKSDRGKEASDLLVEDARRLLRTISPKKKKRSEDGGVESVTRRWIGGVWESQKGLRNENNVTRKSRHCEIWYVAGTTL